MSKNKMKHSQIQKQAKEILDKFALALDKAGISEDDSFVDREEFERGESSFVKEAGGNSDFKKRFLENAPKKNMDFVLVERGGWK